MHAYKRRWYTHFAAPFGLHVRGKFYVVAFDLGRRFFCCTEDFLAATEPVCKFIRRKLPSAFVCHVPRIRATTPFRCSIGHKVHYKYWAYLKNIAVYFTCTCRPIDSFVEEAFFYTYTHTYGHTELAENRILRKFSLRAVPIIHFIKLLRSTQTCTCRETWVDIQKDK